MLIALRWLSRRSWGVLHAIGAALGWLGYGLSGGYRRRLVANAALAGIGSRERRDAIGHAGRMVAELPRLWLREPASPLQPPVQWQGAERIARALDAGRGLLMLTPHLGAFEVIAQAYAERFGARQPMTALYRPPRQAWLRELETTARNRPGLLTAPATLAGVRQMIRALRRGQTVGLLPDQVPPDGMGVWAPFFDRPAYTMTLSSRLALQTGAMVLLTVCERLPHAAGWRISVFDLPEPLPVAAAFGADDSAHQTECAAVMNRAMEFLIRQCPAQYLWGYNRYKSPRASM
jgi:KDO2-lipid IV(A) lauroyltransferase